MQGRVEAYTASLLPPTAMCELVLNLRGPKTSWRTLSELYTLRKIEYDRTVPCGPYNRPLCTKRDFQARWKELVAPVELNDPVATVLPKATGISWPFASCVKYIFSRLGLVRSIGRSFPVTLAPTWPSNLGHANCPPSRNHPWQTSICVWCWCQHQMGGSVGSF